MQLVTDHRHDLLFLLNDLGRLLRTEADRKARTHGMTRAQWSILIWLEREPGLSQRELAALLEVEPITVARLVDRLEAKAMVERRPDGADRRIWRLHLTDAAQGRLAEIHEYRAALSASLVVEMSSAEQAQLLRLLAQMKRLLGTGRPAKIKEVA